MVKYQNNELNGLSFDPFPSDRNVDSSAIIWGVGSNSLQLPIPSTCPDGFKLLVKQCWSTKPRNRPSFKHILIHLDIASVEILSYKPEDYFRTQV